MHDNDSNEEFYNNMISDLKSGILHGILVANISCELARRLGFEKKQIYDLRMAAMLHDVGKLKLSEYLYGRNSHGMSIEEVKYMRMHSKISAEFLRSHGFSEKICEIVLRHHECYDGSGYPDNLIGEAIPYEARIIGVADSFAALISDRPYRKAFDTETAVEIMIDDIKNYDMKVFIEFQRFIHDDSAVKIIKNSNINLDDLDIRDILNI